MEKVKLMEEIELAVKGIGYATAILGVVGSIGFGKLAYQQEKKISRLEQEVYTLTLKNKSLNGERSKLHRDLIERGNPYEWKLNGDALGNSWYERYFGDGAGWAYWYEKIPTE